MEIKPDRKPFLMLLRYSPEFDALIKHRPTAFVLLTLIAKRARRTSDVIIDNLEIGEALIGDYETYGVTEQVYRSDKIFLKKFNFATFRSTNKGTVAKITATSIFDINAEELTHKPTGDHRTTNEQLTTNKNTKNDKVNFQKTIFGVQSNMANKIGSPPDAIDLYAENIERLHREGKI